MGLDGLGVIPSYKILVGNGKRVLLFFINI